MSNVEKMPAPIDIARRKLELMSAQFKAVLPKHIEPEKFIRYVLTEFQNRPDILRCKEHSVWNACMRAAQDGLLPDGREGAIVAYKGEARWMPMIAGIRKMVRNSGEIANWETDVVRAKDKFVYKRGYHPILEHEPFLEGDRGPIIAAYSIAWFKDGSISSEVMSISEIEGVRSKSKAGNGPWADPVFYPEMVRKTVARRHSKVLPLSSDLDDFIRRDDDMYELNGTTQVDKPAAQPKKSLANKLDALALTSPQATTGDVIDLVPQAEDSAAPAPKAQPRVRERETESPAPAPLLTKDQLLGLINKAESKLGVSQIVQNEADSINALSRQDRAEIEFAFDGAFEKAPA
jgi:recombination protein RecT